MTDEPDGPGRGQVARSGARRRPEATDVHRRLQAEVTTALRSRLAELGITQADLARRLNVSSVLVARWLSESGNPTLRTLADLLHATGLRLRLEPADQPPDASPPRSGTVTGDADA